MVTSHYGRTLAIGASYALPVLAYYFVARGRFIPAENLNKQLVPLVAVTLAQTYRPQVENKAVREYLPLATFILMGLGSYASGLSWKANLTTTVAFTTFHYAWYHDSVSKIFQTGIKPPQIPHELPDFFINEAETLKNGMSTVQSKGVELKDLAEILIAIEDARNDGWNDLENKYKGEHRFDYLVRLAREAPKDMASSCLDKLKPQTCAEWVAVAIAQKTQGLDYSQAKSRAQLVGRDAEGHWVKGIDAEDLAPKPITYSKNMPPMSEAEYYLQQGQYQKARDASRKEKWNIFWRIEFLCRLNKAQSANF